MNLITIYLDAVPPEEEARIKAFRDFLGDQMCHPAGTQAVAAFVLVSRARVKLERARCGVDLITGLDTAEEALGAFQRYKQRLGPWLRHMRDELQGAVKERQDRGLQEKKLNAEQDFEAVARRARTVREHNRLHRRTEGEAGD